MIAVLYYIYIENVKRKIMGNKNSGRPKKTDELLMIEKLSPLEPKAFEELKKGIEKGEFAFVKLWFQYMYGKPKQITELNVVTEQPLFDLSKIDLECLQDTRQ